MCVFQMEGAAFIHICFVCLYTDDFCKKHHMAPEINALCDFALDVDRGFFYCRRLDDMAFSRRQAERLELIYISSRADAAEICCRCEFFCGQIDDEFTAFLNQTKGITLSSHRDGDHRRIGTDCPGPCYRKDIRLSRVWITAADHDGRNRVELIAGFSERSFMVRSARCGSACAFRFLSFHSDFFLDMEDRSASGQNDRFLLLVKLFNSD